MKRSYKSGIITILAAILGMVVCSGLFAQDAVTAAKSDGMTVKTSEKADEPKAAEEKPAEKKKDAKKTASKKKEGPKSFTLNFKDIEISEFLNFMGRIIGKNIIIDDTVHGKITIISNKEVPLSEAFEVTKAILEVKGFAIVETNNLLKVMPIRDAIKKNTEIVVDGDKKINIDNQKTMTYLLDLQNAEAQQLSQVLMPLKSQFTDIVVYPVLNTIIFSGSSTEIEGLLKIARALDKAPEKIEAAKAERGNIHVVPLEYANAEDLANILSRVPFSEVAFVNTEAAQVRQSAAANRIAGQPVAQQQQQNKSKLSIIASKEANALIVTAMPKEFEEINRLIKQLDVVREQVLIEALIVEVAANNGWNWGIDWEIGTKAGGQLIGGSQLLSGSLPSYSSPSGLNKTVALPTSTGFQIGFLDSGSILSFGLLNAAKTESDANILSTPQILTTDNQEAEINVGDQIPVATASSSSSSTTTTYTYDYKSVGVKLKLTQHITRNERISIDLYMEVNDITGESQVIGTTIVPPQLSKRDIKTKVTVPNKKTIVVGGLIKNKKSQTVTKVPLLGDIPVIGWLFTNINVSNKKTNLLVFLTPTLLTKGENMEIVTQQKKEEQKLLQKNKD